jgi:hypothetical protein
VTTPCSTTTARFLLLGDSHAGPIGRAATAAGIPCVGGPMGAGRDFTAGFYDPAAGTFHEPEPERYHREFLAELGVAGLRDLGTPLVSTFGLSAHFYATTENWHLHRRRDGGFLPGFLGSALFDAIVAAMARGALDFHAHAVDLGLRVLAVLPPQRVPAMADPQVFAAAQDTLAAALTARGVEIVDVRARVTDAHGRQRPEFCEPDDPIHGNLAFGRIVLADLLDRGL